MAAPNGPPDQQEIPAKSGPSSVPSFLRFINRTPRLVDVIWLNYDGIRIRYKTLPPNGFVSFCILQVHLLRNKADMVIWLMSLKKHLM